jgi:uncharacterized membrane protein (DUF2068 family)
MELLTGTLIFWFLTVGLTVGALVGKIIEWEGVSLFANMIWGGFAGVISGSIAVIMQIGDGILFSFLGTIAVLFLVNVFHQHHKEDVFGEEPTDIRLKRKV